MNNIYSRYGDGILWVALAAATTVALLRARDRLIQVRDASRVYKEEKEQDEIISQKTEDAVKIETLGELLTSPSYDIRQAAVKMIVERMTRGGNIDRLVRNVRSQNPELRAQALASLRYLVDTPIVELLLTTDTLSSIVEFLESTLPQVRTRPFTPTEHVARPQPERDALFVLSRLCRYDEPASGLKLALSVGLVFRYLAHYPYGGPESTQAECMDMVSKLGNNGTDDRYMGNLIHLVFYDLAARKEMHRHGLMGGGFAENDTDVPHITFIPGVHIPPGSTAPTHLRDGDGSRPGTPNPGNPPVSDVDYLVQNADEIRRAMRETPQGREALAAFEHFEGMPFEQMIDAARNVGSDMSLDNSTGVDFTTRTGVARIREESAEEVALRRRRRMAMVVSDGGPLRRDNIYDGPGDDRLE